MYSNLNASRDLMPREQFLWAVPAALTPGANLAASVSQRRRTSLLGRGKGRGGCRLLSLWFPLILLLSSIPVSFPNPELSLTMLFILHDLSAYPVKFPLKLQMKIAVSLRLLFRNTVTMLSWWFIQLRLSLQVYFSAFQITSGRPFYYEFSKVVVFSFIHICKV